MKTSLFRILCRFLVVSIFALPFQHARAGMIGTDEAVAAGSVQADRDLVRSTLARGDVAHQLQAHGVDLNTANERVAAMSDTEVRALAGQIQAAPAGAVSGWIIAVIIAALVWYFYFR